MASRTGAIRVGIIRCDTHGYWYAPFFEAPDPRLYRKVHWGCHYYFYRPENPTKLRIPSAAGMIISKVFDEEDRTLAERLSEGYGGRPKVCDSYEEVSDDVDLVYIADCNYEGKDHLRFATPGLKKGIPHFVDKPFAYTLRDARKMIELAGRHNTAIMCASLLRYSPFLQRFRVQLRDIAPVRQIIIPCGGPSLAGIFHGLSMVQCILGAGCQSVESMGPNLFDVLRLHYAGRGPGVDAILFNARGRAPENECTATNYHHCAYHVSAYGEGGAAHTPLVDDFLFPHSAPRIVRMAKRMAQTRTPPIPYASMLELMETIEAGRRAHHRGRRVTLAEIRKQA